MLGQGVGGLDFIPQLDMKGVSLWAGAEREGANALDSDPDGPRSVRSGTPGPAGSP